MRVAPVVLVPKHLVKKTAQATTALCLVLGAAVSAQAGTVVTFSDSGAAPAIAGACSAIAWTAGSEFRMCDPSGALLGGGAPYQRNAMLGGESWSFNNSGQMVGTAGTLTNPGASAGSAAPTPGSNNTLQQSTQFFGLQFNFLAPTLNSLAGTAYGLGMYTVGAPANGYYASIFSFPVLEAQWGGTYIRLGQASGGVTFSGTLSGCFIVPGSNPTVTDCHFDIYANEYIDAIEDPESAGFAGWTAQWHLQGNNSLVYTAPTAVPVPAAVWLFGSGVLGLAGFARRKKAA